MEQQSRIEPEILQSAIKATCAKFKKATDAYCQMRTRLNSHFYVGKDELKTGAAGAAFDLIVEAYDKRKQVFNGAAQVWLNDFKELPDWAKETIAYQAERGLTDPLWKTWGQSNGITGA
jgi:hypothetical protein